MSKKFKLQSLVASCCENAADDDYPIFGMTNDELATDLHDRSRCSNYAYWRVHRAVRAFRRSNRHAVLLAETTLRQRSA